MNSFLGDLNAKVEKEDILKETIMITNFCKISNDNRVRGVNFATSKNVTVKRYTMLQRQVMCVSSGKHTYFVRLLHCTTHSIFIKIWTSYKNTLTSSKLLSKTFSHKQS
jgi:hypothetical protein